MPTISLTITAAQALRIQAAFRRYWNLDHNPTVAEIRTYLIRQLRSVVLQQERAAAEAQIAIDDLGDV